PADDTAIGSVQFTADGWDNGYSAMSCDRGPATGSIGGNGGFILSNRMEVVNAGDQAAGVSVVYGTATQTGAVVRAILMDANFATIDTSTRRTLQQADIEAIWNGLPVYEAFANTPSLMPGDHYVGIQQLTQNGDIPVHVSVAGPASGGRSVIQEGLGFSLSDLHTTPMVRLHLAPVPVGIAAGENEDRGVTVYPNPASSAVEVVIPATSSQPTWKVADISGRQVKGGTLEGERTTIDLSAVPDGTYILTVGTKHEVHSQRLVVAR
ncbi:MAG: T9SS type A sorting domain-containing protein, partial [Flavobacteriales bacterium]